MRLRAHHFVCLLGFRGLGYSPSFVENLSSIAARLRDRPHTIVEILDGADAVCAACPHLGADASDCDKGPGPHRRDRALLARLGAEPGEQHAWSEWQARLAGALTPEGHRELCEGCRWYPLGYCRDGFDALRAGQAALAEACR